MTRARKLLQPSLVHRLLRITPGYAPRWLCSRNSCGGIDLFSFLIALILFLAVAVLPKWLDVAWGRCLVIVAADGLLVWAYIAFEGPERAGRARRRRGECVWCGQSGATTGAACPDCESRLRNQAK